MHTPRPLPEMPVERTTHPQHKKHRLEDTARMRVWTGSRDATRPCPESARTSNCDSLRAELRDSLTATLPMPCMSFTASAMLSSLKRSTRTPEIAKNNLLCVTCTSGRPQIKRRRVVAKFVSTPCAAMPRPPCARAPPPSCAHLSAPLLGPFRSVSHRCAPREAHDQCPDGAQAGPQRQPQGAPQRRASVS